jgi:hypothetical protein
MDPVFGMVVVGRDGDEAGTLDRVLVDPDRREVIHLMVRPPGTSEDVLVPLSLVQGNSADRLLLRAAAGDLANMPRYDEGRTSSPPAGRIDTSAVREPPERRRDLERALNVAADALELGPDTQVELSGGPPGTVLGLMTDQYTNTVAELRVRVPGPEPSEARLPAEALDELQPAATPGG